MQDSLNNHQWKEMLDALPEGVIWAIPVKEGETIIDFEIAYSNDIANRQIANPAGKLTGLWIKRNAVPGPLAGEANFRHFLNVYQTGEASEFSFYVPGTKSYIGLSRKRFKEGVLSLTRNIQKEMQATANEEVQNRLLHSIIENAPAGIVVYVAVRNDKNVIEDFAVKVFNKEVNRLTGFSDEERRTQPLKSLLKGTSVEGNFERYCKTVETGEPFDLVFYLDRTSRWLSFNGVKFDDGFISIVTDVTHKKKQDDALQQQSEYLDRILNISSSAITSMEAIRNEKGDITDMRYIKINKSFTDMVQMKDTDLLGKTLLTLFPASREAGIFDAYAEALNEGKTVRREIKYKMDFGEAWFDFNVTPFDADTTVSTFSDITQSKIAAIEMERQKTLLDNILMYSSSGISVTEMIRDENGVVVDGRTLLANEAAIKYSGLPRNVYLTKTMRQIDPGMFDSPLYQMALHALQTGEPFQTQYYLEIANKWLELSVSRMDRDHLINIFTDITSAKKAQLQLEKLVDELKRSNANLEEFAYAASHDLKEPIRKVHYFADRLRNKLDGALDDDALRMFDRMETATIRMSTLVDDLLAYSHIGRGIDVYEEIDLNEKVQSVLSDLELQIAEKEARITVHPLPHIRGNRRQLQQLFQNLIGNALKYNKPGVPPEITITANDVKGKDIPGDINAEELQKPFHQIKIQDNGIGFEQKDAERIFNVFQRLHGNAEYKGTGVGLSIAKKAVENLKGYLLAAGTPGEGATFSIYLPIQDGII